MRMVKKSLWKKWCAGVSAVCIAAVGALSGGLPGNFLRGLPDDLVGALPAELAGNAPGSTVHAEEEGVAMGRYLESDVTLPEENFEIQDVVRTTEGTLRIVGSGDGGYTIWDSADGGASWEQTGALPEEYAQTWFTNIRLSPDGGGAATGLDEETSAPEDAGGEASAEGAGASEEAASAEGAGTAEEAGATEEAAGDVEAAGGPGVLDTPPEYRSYLIVFDAQGNVTAKKDQDAESYVLLDFTQGGQLIGLTSFGEVTVFSRDTAEAVNVIVEDADMVGTCGQEVLAFMESELQRYDVASGEPLARDEALEEALYVNLPGADQQHLYGLTSIETVPVLVTEDEEGRLYYATGDGIFAHAMEGNVVEQVVDGSLGSLASSSNKLCAMAVLDQCFYLVCIDDSISGGKKLMKYEYSADTPSVPQKELTLYSLFEGDELRQAITLFQKQYPDIYVNYEAGMSGGDGVTVSDALRTLNTEILAGSGPDILVLDGLPLDSYVEQGLLTDLSGIVAGLRESDGLMDNVVGAYEQDGAFYALPQRFGIVAAVGAPELISGIDSMEAIEALAAQPGTLARYNIAVLSELLYRVSAGSWKNEDGTLDQEKLAEYVHAVRQITDTWKANASQEDLERLESYRQEAGPIDWNKVEALGMHGDDLSSATLDMLSRANSVCLGALYQMFGYSGLTSVNAQTGMCALALPNLTEEKFFVPCGLLGVLSNSKAPEEAAEFVRFLFSAQTQGQIDSDGFPVNRTALETILNTNSLGDGGGIFASSSSSSDGSDYVGLEYKWPTETEINALMAMLQQVSVPVETERVQHDVVIEEMERCLNGETGEDETVNAILQRINLYLAE